MPDPRSRDDQSGLWNRLVDPETRRPVRAATPVEVTALRAALTDGRARRRDGEPAPDRFDGAFLTEDRRAAFLVVDGIPNFLVHERVELDEPLSEEAK
jgi:uncharacterized protein YbaR (Trm112 family)